MLLVPGEMGWVSSLSHAWGFNLWQYLHPGVGPALGLAIVPLASVRLRQLVIDASARLTDALWRPGGRRVLWALLLALPLLFWAVRERRYFGDSTILIYAAMSGSTFVFPEIGATFLLQLAMRAGHALGTPGAGLYRVLVCASSAGAVFCFLGWGRTIAPSRGKAAFAAALVLSSGLARVFAGHVEVYSFVVLCAGAYFWAGCVFLRGGCGIALPGLALGCGMFSHLSFLFLVPSFLLLPLLAEPGRETHHYLRIWVVGLTVAGAPMLGFLLSILVTGHGADLLRAWDVILQMAEVDDDPHRHESWVRSLGRSPGIGTRYVIFSLPHLAYLANAFFLLSPAAVAVVAAFLRRPRSFIATPDLAFLTSASVAMVSYSAVVRPVWGPYDWDVFCLTAACLGALAAALLIHCVREPRFSHVGAALLAATWAFVTIPFLSSAIATPRDAGPFSHPGIIAEGDENSEQAFERLIGPWL